MDTYWAFLIFLLGGMVTVGGTYMSQGIWASVAALGLCMVLFGIIAALEAAIVGMTEELAAAIRRSRPRND
jgi:hypothetical protein